MDALDFAIAQSLARVRAYKRAKNLKNRQLAKLAKLHPNTITKLDDPNWQPELETVRKLESIVPANFNEAA